MTQQLELNALSARLSALDAEYEMLKALKCLVDGECVPGKSPEVVARAIRDGIPLPLKYTQSLLSLKSLYAYAVEHRDTEMTQWSQHQFLHVHGPKAFAVVRDELNQRCRIPEQSKTPRQEFLADLGNMSLPNLNRVLTRLDSSSFWAKQLSRFGRTSQMMTEMVPSLDYQILPVPSVQETLETAIQLHYDGGRVKLTPKKLISDAGIAPFVVLPSLVSVFAKTQNWAMIVNDENLRKTALFKKLTLPVETVVIALRMRKAPEGVITELENKYK